MALGNVTAGGLPVSLSPERGRSRLSASWSAVRLPLSLGGHPVDRVGKGALDEYAGGIAVDIALGDALVPLDEALALTRRFLQVHGDEWDIECEVRPIEESPSGGCGRA